MSCIPAVNTGLKTRWGQAPKIYQNAQLKKIKTLKIKFSYDPEVSLLGYLSKETENVKSKHTCILTFITALFTVVRYGSKLSACNR